MGLSEAEELELLELEEAEYQHKKGASEPGLLKQAGNAIRGFAQGASMGFGDEAQGALEAGGQALGLKGLGANSFDELGLQAPKILDPSSLGDVYRQSRDKARAADAMASQENPALYGTGNLAGAVTSAALPGLGALNAAKGAGLATSAGLGAAGGAVAGLGTSDADLTKGEYWDAASDMTQGAALGGVVGGGAHLVGEGLNALANTNAVKSATNWAGDKLDYLADMASARAQGAERATIKKLGVDKIRQIGRQGLDENTIPLFSSTDDMIARNEAVKARGGRMMGEVYDAIDNAGASTFNPLDVASKVDEQVGGFYRSPINRGETNQLENTLETILMRGENNLPLQDAQALKEELRKVANWKNNLNVTDKERMAREAYGIVSSAIDDAAEQGSQAIGIEGLKEKLGEGKRLYGNAKGAEELLKNKLAREEGNKFFGLTDAITGAGALGYGGSTGDWQTAGGIMALKKGGEKFGPKIVAKSAANIGQLVRAVPQLFGKFAPILQKAESRGTHGLAATHFILQQTNPEYRQVLMKVSDRDENSR